MSTADVVEQAPVPDAPVLDVAVPDTGVLDRAWQVHPKVAVRPEPFGALLYHFGTRRLSFLKNRTVVAIVNALPDHPDARSACLSAGVAEASLPAYEKALATLAGSDMIISREVTT